MDLNLYCARCLLIRISSAKRGVVYEPNKADTIFSGSALCLQCLPGVLWRTGGNIVTQDEWEGLFEE